MPTIYQRCQKDIADLGQELIDDHYSDVKNAAVAIDYVWAFSEPDESGEPTGPALTLHGYTCAGICKVVSSKDRALGHGDVEIQLDGDNWKKLTHAEQVALVDHELEHIVVQVEGHKKELVKRDAYGRPRISIKPHDWQMGWFTNIARRHGMASYECKQASRFWTRQGAIYVPPGYSYQGEGLNDPEEASEDLQA